MSPCESAANSTPSTTRLHRRGERLYLTWTDLSSAHASRGCKSSTDPHAHFDAIKNVTIRHHAGASLIAFSRDEWSVMAWTDARSYAASVTDGEVQLFASVLGPDLAAANEVLFAHTHFIEGTGDLRGAPAGSNAIITWIDERHGGTVLDPRPEVYLETVWQ